jgi:hypothetical protein
MEDKKEKEVIPKELSSKVGQLQRAIAELANYLETQSMDCYFNNLLVQLDKLSHDVNTRLEEVSTFYTFLVRDNFVIFVGYYFLFLLFCDTAIVSCDSCRFDFSIS